MSENPPALSPLWLHRTWLICAFPWVLALSIIVGLFTGPADLAIYTIKSFCRHWRDQ